MANPFDQFDAPQTPAAVPGVIRGRTDPTKQAADTRDKIRTDIAVRNEARGISNDQYQQAQGLAQDYTVNPVVKSYETGLGALSSALKRVPDATGDLALIYDFAKVMDPGSVVREGEMAMAGNTASMIESAVARYKKEFDIEGGGQLSPEIRNRIKQEMIRKVASFKDGYNFQRKQYEEKAKAYGLDPFLVVGNDLANDPAHREAMRAYDKERGIGVFAGQAGGEAGGQASGPNGGATNPEMRGGLPVGTDITFGKQEPDWWDRDKALKEKFGVTPDQEQLITAFWNQNGATASPQAIKQWYSSQGLPVPTDDVIRQGIEHGRKGGEFGSFDLSQEKAAYENQIKVNLDSQGFDPNSAGAYTDRPMQGALFGLGDELSGAIGAAGAIVNDQGVRTAYTQARDTARYALDQEAQAQGFTGNALEFAGGLATGSLIRGGPVVGGAAAGGLAGFGYGNGAQGSVTNALAGAAFGGAAGYGAEKAAPYIGRGVNAVRQRGNANIRNALAPEARTTLEAFDRQGITARRPDLIPAERGRAGAIQQTEGGRPIIDAAYADDLAQVEGRVTALGGSGTPGDPMAVGTRIQEGVTRAKGNMKASASARYTRAEKMAGNPTVVPQEAVKNLAATIAQLQRNPNSNAAEIKFLTGIGEDLSTPGGKTIQEIRDIRTNLRGQIKEAGLDATQAEARVMDALEAASTDIEKALGNNKMALAEYKAADAQWRQQKEFSKQVVERLLGPKNNPFSPERTAAAVDSMMKSKGDFGRFKQVIDALDPAERADLSASVFGNMGRDTNGNFSFKLFMNAVDGMNPRAVRVLAGEDGARALKDLRVIAGAKHEAQSARNFSNTGGVVSRVGGGLKDLLWGAMAYSSAGPAGGVVAQAGSNLFRKLGDARAARLLMNPKFTNAIRQAPQTSNPKAIDAYFGRLVKSVSATPQAANDVDAFVGALRESFARSPERAAAQEKQD